MPKVDRNHELITALQQLSKKNPKLVKSSEYVAPADSSITVRSWKMNEFKYYDVPSPFPTLARGLFTRWVSDKEGEKSKEGSDSGRHVIVARGYDKFFNIGEVPWTNWKALETHTVAPYHLTLKSNGCIIFIGALTPTKLIITSKHSIGPIQGQHESHSQVGQRWLRKHLEAIGKTEEQLAQTLWERNETAVAELCDDSFEEHVLPIPEEMTGLHLHGLNTRSGAFQTRDPQEVEAFAREWGLIPTVFTTLNTVEEVKSFTQEVSKVGKWQGIAIEGFVVRTKIADSEDAPHTAEEVLNVDGEKTNGRKRRDGRDAPPYPPGSSFFYKVKFDEPYMMYRDWREITKTILSARPGSEPRISKAKLNRPETRLYKQWVEGEIKNNRKAFDGYTNNHGIIATRERFLKWCEEQGHAKLARDLESHAGTVRESPKHNFGKTVIIPVAIPGCGKTTIAVALKHIFGFGHTQSDDVKAKKPAPIFLKNVTDLLKTHNVVIADKNNHLEQHRYGLRQAVTKITPPVRLLALNWSIENMPPAITHRICGDRVTQRGENHQSLRADEAKSHEEVIWMFIEKTEPLSEKEVDDVIEMDVDEDIESNLARAVEGIVRILGIERPSEEKVKEALTLARTYAYTPAQRQKEKEGKKEKEMKFRYFGILPEIDLDVIVGNKMAELTETHPARVFWEKLKADQRVTTRPHITIVHSKSLPGEQDLWDRCVSLHRSPTPPSFTFKLDQIVCNDRVMALAVSELTLATGQDGDCGGEDAQFVNKIATRLHITLGTLRRDINPYEAKALVHDWRGGIADDMVTAVPLDGVSAQGRVKGLMS